MMVEVVESILRKSTVASDTVDVCGCHNPKLDPTPKLKLELRPP